MLTDNKEHIFTEEDDGVSESYANFTAIHYQYCEIHLSFTNNFLIITSY